MEIKSSFNVPLAPAEAWRVLMDIPRVAPCMPGAELVGQIDERTYKGNVSVRLGPIALAFAGTARFETLDEGAKHARVTAQGTDAKGRGGASATIDFQLAPIPEGTSVNVATDVTLSGSVAQYGRATGIIQGVANQLLGQFAENLKQSLNLQEGSSRETDAEKPEPEPAQAQRPVVEGTKPISALGLIAHAIWGTITRWFVRERHGDGSSRAQ